MSMSAADYLTLPKRIDNVIPVRLTESEMTLYRTMEQEQLLHLGDSDDIVALNAAAVMTKLLQIANGRAYNVDGQPVDIHRKKLEALQEIIEQADGPVLVFYQFEEDGRHLMDVLPDARPLHTESDIKAWNDGKVPVLLAHPASVGYGLNLQDGGHVIVWYGLTWSLEQYSQANARLHRQGQKKPVLVYQIVAKGTVDEQILASLHRKHTTQEAVLEILKERRGR